MGGGLMDWDAFVPSCYTSYWARTEDPEVEEDPKDFDDDDDEDDDDEVDWNDEDDE
jgi:hypothetical protein